MINLLWRKKKIVFAFHLASAPPRGRTMASPESRYAVQCARSAVLRANTGVMIKQTAGSCMSQLSGHRGCHLRSLQSEDAEDEVATETLLLAGLSTRYQSPSPLIEATALYHHHLHIMMTECAANSE